MHHICIFEDTQYSRLFPLTYSRATFEVRCGFLTPLERAIKQYPGSIITIFCRDYLENKMKEQYTYSVNDLQITDDTCLFINGRAILSLPIPAEGREEIGIQGTTLVYARLKGENAKKITPETLLAKDIIERLKDSFQMVNIDTPVVNFFWDILRYNKFQMEKDFMLFVKEGHVLGNLYEGVYLINEDQICIERNSLVKPCCVLDAENGPIYIGKNVIVAPNTTIEGPAYIGDYSVIQANSRLRGGTNIGKVCKAGGEIVNTIFHSYSNKQHDGFLGDSYIGSWVNLGADTINSNLLNTYGKIKVQLGKEVIDTGTMFLGMAMGDHTKTAINTTIMTGSVFGFACNIVCSTYPPKYLPSFSWYSDNGIRPYRLEKALQVAKIAMKRRDMEMSRSEEELFRKIYQLTESERDCV